MKLYCPTCGSGTEYSLKKPQFCGSCGASFNSISQNNAKNVFKTKPVSKPVLVEREEEEEKRRKIDEHGWSNVSPDALTNTASGENPSVQQPKAQLEG